MAWIEAHQNLPSHPKTKRLARLLNISIREAVGSLYMFWWWAMEYAEDGDLSNYDASDIADGVQWDGEPQEFLNAMINCGPGNKSGFIDKTEDGMFIHDWQEYGGHYLEMREKNRKRVEKYRAENSETRMKQDCNAYSTRTKRANITEQDTTQHNLHNTTEQDTKNTTIPTHHPDDAVNLNEIILCWNEKLVPLGFPSVLKNTPARDKALNARINNSLDRKKLEWWKALFDRIALSDFLKNSAQERSWFTLDWLLNENNLVKVLEGKYDNRIQATQPPLRSIDEILASHTAGMAIDAEFEVKSDD